MARSQHQSLDLPETAPTSASQPGATLAGATAETGHVTILPPEAIDWLSLPADIGTTLSWSVRLTRTEQAWGWELRANPKEDQVALAPVPSW